MLIEFFFTIFSSLRCYRIGSRNYWQSSSGFAKVALNCTVEQFNILARVFSILYNFCIVFLLVKYKAIYLQFFYDISFSSTLHRIVREFKRASCQASDCRVRLSGYARNERMHAMCVCLSAA